MKGLFFADLHLDNSLPYGEILEDGTNSRLLDEIDVAAQIFEYSIAPGVEFVCCNGDWVSNPIADPYVLRASAQLLEIADEDGLKPLFIEAGNHEFFNKDCTVSVFAQYREFQGRFNHVKFIETPEVHHIGDVQLTFIPYRRALDDHALATLLKAYPPEGRHSVLNLHSPVYGATLNALAKTKSKFGLSTQILSETGYEWVVLGDFHAPQALLPNGNVFYCGAPLQHTFQDLQSVRGFWEIDFDAKVARLIPTQYPEFIKLQLTAKEAKGFDFSQVVKKKSIVNVTIVSDSEYDMQNLRGLLVELGAGRIITRLQKEKKKSLITNGVIAREISRFNIPEIIEGKVASDESIPEKDKPRFLGVGMEYFNKGSGKNAEGQS